MMGKEQVPYEYWRYIGNKDAGYQMPDAGQDIRLDDLLQQSL